MASGIECSAGDGQPAAWMLTSMVEGGNTLLCAEHWVGTCMAVAQAAGALLPVNEAEPAADGPAAPSPAVDEPVDGPAVQGAAEDVSGSAGGPPAFPLTEHHVKRGRAAAHKRRAETKHADLGQDFGPPRGTDIPEDFGPEQAVTYPDAQ